MEICVAFVAVTVSTAAPPEEIEVGLAFKVTRTIGSPDVPEPHPLKIKSGNRKKIHCAFTEARQLRRAPHDSSTAFLLFHMGVECAAKHQRYDQEPKRPAISHFACIFVTHTTKEPVLDSHLSPSVIRPQAVRGSAPASHGAARLSLPGQHIHH